MSSKRSATFLQMENSRLKILEPVFDHEKYRIGERFLMPQETKKRHKAGAYGAFLVKCGAKIAAKTVVSNIEYRFLERRGFFA